MRWQPIVLIGSIVIVLLLAYYLFFYKKTSVISVETGEDNPILAAQNEFHANLIAHILTICGYIWHTHINEEEDIEVRNIDFNTQLIMIYHENELVRLHCIYSKNLIIADYIFDDEEANVHLKHRKKFRIKHGSIRYDKFQHFIFKNLNHAIYLACPKDRGKALVECLKISRVIAETEKIPDDRFVEMLFEVWDDMPLNITKKNTNRDVTIMTKMMAALLRLYPDEFVRFLQKNKENESSQEENKD